ncbi:hypothetical protein CK228_31130 [Mesorhizobium sp. WSM4312]|uniref:hypothetical protein n=1 Tax=Mesorhizobium sp. WSM4312 TaxID=2029411 RepID=UPI000BAEE105|nr:hypothetical protein [Mesorhizobium sp. WSM4312]PBB64784.1 hypothetical protein CK228_31130 [Mesorhizobium sp. WSM4312]
MKLSEGNRQLILCALIAAPILIGVGAAYVNVEDPDYVWDYGAYWKIFQQYGTLIGSSADWVSIALGSIRNDDYNASAAILLYPFFALFGGSRTAYIVAIVLVYLLPATLVATIVTGRISKATSNTLAWIFLIAVTYLPFWSPTLRGMLDIVGLVPLGLATLLIFRSNFLERRPVVSGLAIGLLVWMPFLFRRWYAFSVVIFFVMSFLFGLIRHRQSGLSKLAWPLVGLSIAGALFLVLVFSFQFGLVMRALSTSYGDLYDSYQASAWIHIRSAWNRLGPCVVMMMIIGVAVALARRNFEAIFCLCAALATFIFFAKTQQLGAHHFLPVAFWLFPVYFLGIDWIANRLIVLPANLRLMPFGALSVLSFTVSIAPIAGMSGALGVVAPLVDNRPLRIENFAEYEKLVHDLEATLMPDAHVVIFSSSMVLSDALIAVLSPALDPHINYAPHIAKLRLFPFELLRSEYAIAVTPPQAATGQAPSSQANITVPGEMLLKHAGFGEAFEQTGKSYKLGANVTAYLLRRTRPVTPSEMKQLLDILGATYADWPAYYFHTMLIPFAAREVQLGDVWGVAKVLGPSELFLHPGATKPTSVAIPLASSVAERPISMAFSISRDVLGHCPNADGVIARVELNAREIWAGPVGPGNQISIDLPPEDGLLMITVENRTGPNCDDVDVSFRQPTQ